MTATENLREIRDQLNIKMQDMTHEQIKDYLKNEKTLHGVSVWKNQLSKV
jgi:hypothetical protein